MRNLIRISPGKSDILIRISLSKGELSKNITLGQGLTVLHPHLVSQMIHMSTPPLPPFLILGKFLQREEGGGRGGGEHIF